MFSLKCSISNISSIASLEFCSEIFLGFHFIARATFSCLTMFNIRFSILSSKNGLGVVDHAL